MATERPRRYSLRGLIALVTVVAVFLALVRVVAMHPPLLSALAPIYCIAVVFTPIFLTRFESVDTRIALGCIVSPIVYLFLALLFTAICMSYRSLVLS